MTLMIFVDAEEQKVGNKEIEEDAERTPTEVNEPKLSNAKKLLQKEIIDGRIR